MGESIDKQCKYLPPPNENREIYEISLKLNKTCDINESLEALKNFDKVLPFSALCDAKNCIDFNAVNSIKHPEKLNWIVGENLKDPGAEDVVQQLRCCMFLDSSKVYIQLLLEDNNDLANIMRFYDRNLLAIVSIENGSHWRNWQNFYTNLSHKPNVKVALELSDKTISEEEISRWLGEPIDTLIVKSEYFAGSSSKLILKPDIENLIKALNVTKRLNFVISGGADFDFLQNCAVHLKRLVDDIVPASAYKTDWLQNPPNIYDLYQHQDPAEFKFIENDTIKYGKYLEAIESAIKDNTKSSITLLVLGQATIKLVETVLLAVDNTKRQLKIYIAENIPQVLFNLKVLLETIWKDKGLHLIAKSRVDLILPEKVDIVVSDFLASFGDNALGPENLFNLKKYLNADGISIPASTVSYIQPIMSATADNLLKESGNLDTGGYKTWMWDIYHACNLKSFYKIDEPKELLRFNYPATEEISTRNKSVKFNAKIDCVLNGFLGYFEATLYKDIKVGNLPALEPKLYSLPPVYFPIEHPQSIASDKQIEFCIWRTNSYNVMFYEWQMIQPVLTRIHNKKGAIQHVQQ